MKSVFSFFSKNKIWKIIDFLFYDKIEKSNKYRVSWKARGVGGLPPLIEYRPTKPKALQNFPKISTLKSVFNIFNEKRKSGWISFFVLNRKIENLNYFQFPFCFQCKNQMNSLGHALYMPRKQLFKKRSSVDAFELSTMTVPKKSNPPPKNLKVSFY